MSGVELARRYQIEMVTMSNKHYTCAFVELDVITVVSIKIIYNKIMFLNSLISFKSFFHRIRRVVFVRIRPYMPYDPG